MNEYLTTKAFFVTEHLITSQRTISREQDTDIIHQIN